MKKTILTLVLITSIFFAYAGEDKKKATTTLSGTVTDAVTNEPLAGVEIEINGVSVFSDLNGNYKVENLVPGEYELNVSYISYQEAKNIKVDTEQKSYDLSLTAE